MPDDETPIEELEAPGADTSHEAERNLVTILTTDLNEVGVGLATMATAWLRPTALRKSSTNSASRRPTAKAAVPLTVRYIGSNTAPRNIRLW